MTQWCTTAEAVAVIRSGQRVFVQGALATPTPLIEALVAHSAELQHVEITHLHTYGPMPYTEAEWEGHVRWGRRSISPVQRWTTRAPSLRSSISRYHARTAMRLCRSAASTVPWRGMRRCTPSLPPPATPRSARSGRPWQRWWMWGDAAIGHYLPAGLAPGELAPVAGHISRIVPTLSAGASVTTTRAHVHYVATEYGVAYLHGADLGERARRLIAIAAPEFREDLERAAQALHLIT